MRSGRAARKLPQASATVGLGRRSFGSAGCGDEKGGSGAARVVCEARGGAHAAVTAGGLIPLRSATLAPCF